MVKMRVTGKYVRKRMNIVSFKFKCQCSLPSSQTPLKMASGIFDSTCVPVHRMLGGTEIDVLLGRKRNSKTNMSNSLHLMIS